MEDEEINTKSKPNSFQSRILSLKQFKQPENPKPWKKGKSAFIASYDNLCYCLDFVPKLK